jgi:predicted DCC family thiol-disulfide oxidoreductase YuxK
MNRPAKEKAPVAVLYDAKCSFCSRTIEVIRALDIFHRLDFYGMQWPHTREKFPDFDPKRGEREMLVRRGGRWFGGFDGFRVIAFEIPLLWFFVPFLYLPRISGPGNWLYQRVAQRRYCVLNDSP